MMCKLSAILALLFIVGIEVNAQDYSFTHYDKQDGLPGYVVYSMTQDKDGFIWIGTESGLSRFDGSRFINYTTLDGLPDNEVLNVFADSKNRIWAMPFRVSICYYYKGKIHTPENDSLLKKIRLATHASNVCEDFEGNILIQEFGKNLYLITTEGEVVHFNPDPGGRLFIQTGRRSQGGFWVQQANGIYILENKRLTFHKDLKTPFDHYFNSAILPGQIAYRTTRTETTLTDLETDQVVQKFPLPEERARVALVDNGTLAYYTKQGAYVYNIGSNKPPRIYLPNTNINKVFIDDEKNWWFCTYGNGIYRLNSEVVKNVTFNHGKDHSQVIMVLACDQKRIYAGSDDGAIYSFTFQNDSLINGPVIPYPDKVRSPVSDISIARDGSMVYGSQVTLLGLDSALKFTFKQASTSTKKIIRDKNDNLLIATGVDAVRFDVSKELVTDTIWKGRTTTLFLKGDTLYVGTLGGLYCIYPDKKVEFIGDSIPVLRNRITSMAQTDNGVLWVATYGNGIVGLLDNKLFAKLTEDDGLRSNICRTIAVKGSYLWIGSDKGLSKLYTADRRFPITNYTSQDGLIHETINAISLVDSMVFVGSYGGLTYFNETLLSQESPCRLRMNGIHVNYNFLCTDTSSLDLEHDQNNLRFDYVGLSYRSQGNIGYKYRMLGLDSTWKTTREVSLSFHGLQSGEYTFQLQAINRFGIMSNMVSIPFTIKKTLWEKTWVSALLSLLFLSFIVLVTMTISRQIKRREKEKAQVNQRMAELEQLALKSQMNPHFIFNSLNSIQQYVMDKDIAGANKFISDFSRLIRQTLDFSSKPFVSLTDELNYIATYLELEKTRLEGKFKYQIDISPELKGADFPIPPMILQPYVENSIRHGIRYRKDDLGMIDIRVSRHNQYIVVVIEDNGIGRKMAAYYKTANPIEYQSKGMSLTADRLELMNRNFSKKITVLLEDLVDQSLEPLGTRVTINFPEEYF